MRRKKDRSIYPCQSLTKPINMTTIIPTITANTIVWSFIVSLCCLFSYVSCDDTAFNSKISTFSGHVKSTTPMQPELFTNHSAHLIDEQILSTNQSSSSSSSSSSSAWQSKGRTFVRSGNELWDGLVNECMSKPSFSCFQKNIYTYLDDTLRLADVNVTDRILFKKIDIDPNLLAQLQNTTEDDHDNEISDGETREFKSESPIEEVTNALYGKWRNFMMTHNLELKMPEIIFDGATFRITPRAFEGDGALIKLEMIPKALSDNHVDGRLFGLKKKISKTFHSLKKKLFKHKLLLSFLAIVLVIKLIKIKLFWLLPLIVGVSAAKKLLLKFILFLFPALSHLFKLCSYYHKNYHETKYHHHHHSINHLHTVVPPWYKDFVNNPHHSHHGVVLSSPPRGHPVEYIHGIPPPSTHQHYPSDWEHSGPGLGSEYISDIHRNINVNSNAKSETYKPRLEDEETINSWGLDAQNAVKPAESTIDTYLDNPQSSLSPYPAVPTVESSIGRTPISDNAIGENTKIFSTYEPSSQLKYSANKFAIAENIQNALRHQSAYAQTMSAADPFYGPIVARIDSILNQYGAYIGEHCKEWLVCNMYKNPSAFSPHSNFLSAELSRDSSELQKPSQLNAAVLTFYKYVKAARDGQDQKSCLSLNPKC